MDVVKFLNIVNVVSAVIMIFIAISVPLAMVGWSIIRPPFENLKFAFLLALFASAFTAFTLSSLLLDEVRKNTTNSSGRVWRWCNGGL